MEKTHLKHTWWQPPVFLAAVCVLLAMSQGAWAKQHALGDIPVDKETYKKFLKDTRWERAAVALPASYDARDEGIVTSAKNQGSCGSCWAFASVGAMESHVLDTYGFGPTDLSEEQLLVCSGYGSCAGGSAFALFHWDTSSDARGPNYEGCFPYYGNDSTPCTEDACEQIAYRVVNFHSVRTEDDFGNPTAEYFKESLYTNGPSYWRYNVYTDFDSYWATGSPGDVYVGQSGASYRGGHAVLLIGWDDARGALLCKNSWGATGGPNGDGTFWIAYDGHAQSMGFGMYNFDVVLAGCVAEICGDGLDNDCDGMIDCDDTDCDGNTACSFCGDGVCEGEETVGNCSEDCFCTNGTCDPGEDLCSCPEDCGTRPGTEAGSCSDGLDNDCDGAVDCDDTDCAGQLVCTCGDGVCDLDETCGSCPADCVLEAGSCDDCVNGVCNGVCHPKKETELCADCAPTSCCGDGVCDGRENQSNCPRDCTTVCGDGVCGDGETSADCPADCPEPTDMETGFCADGLDNDFDGWVDCNDADCSNDPACTACLTRKEPCQTDDECCSGRCFRGLCK